MNPPREQQRPGGKIERGQADPPCALGAARLPLQTTGDHQVEHHEPLPRESDHDALAEPAEGLHPPSQEALQGRLNRAQQEGAAHPGHLQRLPADPRPQRLQVDLDVRMLGHVGRVTRAGGGVKVFCRCRGLRPSKVIHPKSPRGGKRLVYKERHLAPN